MADPVTGNIAPVHAGILENVAGDVGELHGDAEIDGMRPCCRRVAVENVAHQQADGSRHPVGVAEQRGLVGERHLFGLILEQPVDQRHKHVRWKAFFPHQRQECKECGISPLAASNQIGTDGGKPRRAVLYIAVGHIVEKPAERIERGCVASHALSQKTACPVETLAVGGKRLFGCQLFVRHGCRLPPSGPLCQPSAGGGRPVFLFNQSLDNLSRTQDAWHPCSRMRAGG